MSDLAQRQKKLLNYESVLSNYDLPERTKNQLTILVQQYRRILFDLNEQNSQLLIPQLINLERQLESHTEFARLNSV